MSSEARATLTRADDPGQRELVIAAAGQLLGSSGLDALTFDTLAAQAQVAEESIRRWWPSEEALVLDVLRREWIVRAAHVRRAAIRCGL